VSDTPTAADPPVLPLPGRAFAIVWLIFWLLMATIAVQDHLRFGRLALWQPLLWEGSSALVATLGVIALWRQLPKLDRHLPSPWRWLQWPLLAMLPAALFFVLMVQALRHGAHAWIGVPYRHDPWLQLIAYETVKFCIFYLLFVALLFGLRSHAAMQAQQTLAREAQLRQLAQQIEPHFLFNALNTIAATVHQTPDLADRLITQLSGLLRASMNAARRPHVPLSEELELARAYAAIMVSRFGERVRVDFEADPAALPFAVPVLLLQPLLENAFRHGVEKHPGPARLSVAARLGAGRLRLEVRCDLGRLHPDPDADPGNGVGLGNLRQRLALAFGDAASLRLQALAPAGVEAVVVLPCVS
jgi:hypothetical protein